MASSDHDGSEIELDSPDAAEDQEPEEEADGGEDEVDESDHGQHGAGAVRAKGVRGGKGKGKGSGRGRGRAKVKHGATRQCQACFKSRPIAEFPAGTNKDHDCQRALNVIYNAAERQQQIDWYYEVTGSQASLKKLMAEYFRLHPKSPGSKRAPPVKLLQLKESVKVSEMVDKDVVGEMMHEDHFVYWAGKKKNLGMPDEEAKILFKKLLKMPAAITDKEGPHANKPMRVWVETRKMVIFRNRVEKAKSYDLLGKQVKKATADDVDKAFAEIQTGQEKLGGTSVGIDLTNMAQFMAGSKGIDKTFEGVVAMLPDVRQLVQAPSQAEQDRRLDPDESAEEEEEQVDGEDDTRSRRSVKTASGKGKRPAASEAAGTPTPKKKATAERWFDRDAQVSDASRQLKKTHAGFAKSIKEILTGIREAMDEVEKSGVKDIVQNEAAILNNRAVACKKVLGEDSTDLEDNEPLKEYLVRVRTAVTKKKASSSTDQPGDRARLGQGPPSKNYVDLITLPDLVDQLGNTSCYLWCSPCRYVHIL